MGVVDAQRINDHLSNPEWSESQWVECEKLCAEKESQLEAILVNPITPVPWDETATVLDTGLVATTYAVYSVTEWQGAVVDDAHPLPDPWLLRRHRVRARVPATGTLLDPLGLDGLGLSGVAPRIQGQGQVTIAYMAGWGAESALVGAIVDKVSAIMHNRHDDTIITDESGSSNGRQTAAFREEWIKADLDPLGVFRNPRGLAWR